MFGTYMARIGAPAVATTGPGESKLVLAIAALFVVAVFTVSRFLFAQKPQASSRPAMDQVLAQGMNTLYGPSFGRTDTRASADRAGASDSRCPDIRIKNVFIG